MRAALLAIGLLAVPSAAGASDFWESVLDPGVPRYRAAVSAGRLHLARGEWGLALVQLERAVAAQPDRAEAHRLRGDALRALERWEAAVDAWTRARSLDPLLAYDASFGFRVAFGLAHLGRTAEALEEYRRLLSATGPGQRLRAAVFSNAADLLMSLGPERLDEAISFYRSALAEGPSLPARWGLALALDRAGRDAEKAPLLEHLRRFDPRMTTLSDEDALFVPPEDRHAYQALGFEAFGDPVRAELEWQAFLDAGGGAGPWADSAQGHLLSLRTRAARAPASRTP